MSSDQSNHLINLGFCITKGILCDFRVVGLVVSFSLKTESVCNDSHKGKQLNASVGLDTLTHYKGNENLFN